MNVVYHSSELFSSVTSVSIASLLENNRWCSNINITYISKGLSNDSKNKLVLLVKKYHASISFIEMPDWAAKLPIELVSCKKKWLGLGFNRLFILDLLPNDVEKVLYFDSDTIVEDSLFELWNTNIEDYYLAGVDDCLSSKYRELVDLKANGVYVNSGVLLFNLKKWREDKVKDQLIDYLISCNGYFVFNEQSVLNSFFENKILILDQKYNVNSLVYLFSYKQLLKLRKPFNYSYSEKELIESREKPVITHFTGNFLVLRRPWVNDSDHPHKAAYLKYRELSPWREEPLMKDNSGFAKKLIVKILQTVPRFISIPIISFIYNTLRPIKLKKQLDKARSSNGK